MNNNQNKKNQGKGKSKDSKKKENAASPAAREFHKQLLRAPCLSDCAVKYAKAIHAPWNEIDACVPIMPCFPSQKVSAWVKGTFSTGTASTGFVLVVPEVLAASDVYGVSYTGSTYAGSTLVQTGTGVVQKYSNSPFLDANFSAGDVIGRVVACGVRVRYAGTELERGGIILSICHPDHSSLDTSSSSDLEAFSTVHAEPVNRKWHECVWYPIDATEVAYKDLTTGSACMGIMVTAPSTDPLLFEFEVYLRFEAIGSATRGHTSMAGDVVGGSAVLDHFQTGAKTGRITSSAESLRRTLKSADALVKQGSGIYQSAKSAVSTAKSWWDTASSYANVAVDAFALL